MSLLNMIFGAPGSQQSQSLGLLAANAAQGNFAGGLLAANQVYSPENQLRMKMAQMQMQEMEQGMAERQRANKSREQLDAAARDSYVSPDLSRLLSTGPMPDGSAMQGPAPGFDTRGFIGKAYGIDPMKALSIEQSMAKDDKPMTVAAGSVVWDPKTQKPIFTAPQEKKPPSAVQEYEYAKEQGFAGSFEQWEMGKRRAGATSVSVNTGQKGLDNELKIRSDFRSEPIYKAHQEVQSAYSQIQQSLGLASPAGDLAGATKIMKLLDPGSVVRESELGMAMKATGAMDRLTNYGSMVLNGTKLTPSQRKDFQNLADKLYTESANQYNGKHKEYSGFATDYGLNANRIVGPAITTPKLPQKPAQPGAVPGLQDLLDKYAPK